MTTIRRDSESEADFAARQEVDRAADSATVKLQKDRVEADNAQRVAEKERDAQAAKVRDTAEIAKNKPKGMFERQADFDKRAHDGRRSDEPEKELTVQERLVALRDAMRFQARHAAPVSPAMLTEMDAIVAVGGGTGTVVRHDFRECSLITKDGTAVVMVHTVEEALDFVRALPGEVRDRPHWKEAERRLLLAMDSNEISAVNYAQDAFDAALMADRKLTPLDRKPDERLPDGRLREDRFADRRMPPPPPVAEEARPA